MTDVEVVALGCDLPDLRLFVHGDQDQHVSRQLRDTGVWEPYETKLISQRLAVGDVFVDVGANIGYFSILAASIVGTSGKVFAFEPDPLNFSLLEKSKALNDLGVQLVAENKGLSNCDSNARLFLSDSNLGDHQVFAGTDQRRSVAIQLLNGSDYLSERTDRIDFIKIDVQGAEYHVIEGLKPLLHSLTDKPDILIELTPYSLRQAGASGRKLIELLQELALNFFIVDHIEHQLVASTAAELALWCDNVDSCADDEGFMNIILSAADLAALDTTAL